MPNKNIIKTYLSDGVYHIYNRGVEKRKIFIDEKDYYVFLRFLKEALTDPSLLPKDPKRIKKRRKNFYDRIDLLAYCLMPNHFHLLIKQKTERAMKEFMQSLATRYSIYFNWRHNRIGSLFQSNYKAILIEDEPYLLHVSRYIHRNPIDYFDVLIDSYSSYAQYLGVKSVLWVKPQDILSLFSTSKDKQYQTYQDFVEYADDELTLITEEMIKKSL